MSEEGKPDEPLGGPPGWMKDLGLFGVIVGEIAGFTGVGIGIGYLVWKKWGAPWWVILLTSLSGLSMAMYRLYRMTRNEMKENGDH